MVEAGGGVGWGGDGGWGLGAGLRSHLVCDRN